MSSDVLFIDRLPKPDAQYESSGHICRKCAKPYDRNFKKAYRVRPALLKRLGGQWDGCKTKEDKWLTILKHNREGWAIEKAHVRATILANPDMLRDLECDAVSKDEAGRYLPYAYSSPWTDIKKAYDLPDLPTYHEQVFLKHKGVTVYYQYDPSHASWLALRPDPRFRDQYHCPEVFSPCSLPTWKSPKEYHANLYGEETREARRAVIEAIDKGILTQDGIKKRKATP